MGEEGKRRLIVPEPSLVELELDAEEKEKLRKMSIETKKGRNELLRNFIRTGLGLPSEAVQSK